jgi:hypothetical protein
MASKTDGRYQAELILWNADGEDNCWAEIIVRSAGKEMVIDCARQDGEGSAVLLKSKGPFFSAKNSSKAGELEVAARWVALDKAGKDFVGTWVEDGQEFLLRFKLGRKEALG